MDSGPDGWEAVNHTADIAIRARAADLRGLLEQAARGMLGVMLEEPPTATDYRTVTGTGPSPEDLLVDCLREILALLTIEGLIPVAVRVDALDDERAVCEVGVVEIASGRDVLTQEIKAVTYHDLEIVQTGDHLEVTVVFDV